MLAETATMLEHSGELINAYLAPPLGKGLFPGIVLVAPIPGWSD